jgi:hypothetical protein
MVKMDYELTFSHLHIYDPGKPGITIPVSLSLGGVTVRIDAKVDSGSTFCIFERMYGEDLGLDIESGHPELIGSAMGAFKTYGHMVTLSVLELDFDAMVFFAANPAINRNVLGRHGFLNRNLIGLDDYDGKFFLKRKG